MTPDDILSLFPETSYGVFAIDPEQRIVCWNPAAERILGHASADVIGQRCDAVQSQHAGPGLMPECASGCPAFRAFRQGSLPQTSTLELLTATGDCKTVRLVNVVISGARERLLLYLIEEEPDQQAAEREAASRPVDDPERAGAQRLTAREREVLQLIASGRTTDEIANDLGISAHTVRNHVRNVRRSLRARTKLEAVLIAMRSGLLD